MPETTSDLDFAQLLGDLYARWTLDVLVDTAHTVAKDFVARPEFYKSGRVDDAIVPLRIEYGFAAALPNYDQRREIAIPIFGESDCYGEREGDKFRALRKPLLDACSIISERSVADSAASMRQSVLSALQLFQPYLRSYDGVSLRHSHRQLVSVTNTAFDVLRSPGIGQVFGVNPAPAATWPLDSNDSNGALLVRAIGEKLPLSVKAINEDKFQRLRRVAQQGRDALIAVLSTSDQAGEQLDTMITGVYTWAISLRDHAVG